MGTIFSKSGRPVTDKFPAGFMGDSIAEGYGVSHEDSCWHVFEKLSGLAVIKTAGFTNPLSFAGIGVRELGSRVDDLMARWRPGIVFLSIGANNFDAECNPAYPFGVTSDEIAFFIKSIVNCIKGYGAVPFWLGLPAFESCGIMQEKPKAFNSIMNKWLESEKLPCSFFIDRLTSEKNWDAMGGPFYNNLAFDMHPNASGYRLLAEECFLKMAEFFGGTL